MSKLPAKAVKEINNKYGKVYLSMAVASSKRSSSPIKPGATKEMSIGDMITPIKVMTKRIRPSVPATESTRYLTSS